MKTIPRLFILLTALLSFSSCSKDIVDLTGSITGTIKDSENGSFLENCRVVLSPGGKSASTDGAGSFSFENLDPGSYALSFSKLGYIDENQEVTVITGQTARVSLMLKPVKATTGSISGVIKDYSIGALIANCMVTISPGGKSMTSSTAGTYVFNDLSAGEYSLSFTKSGYEDETLTTVVTAGKTTTADVLLKAKASFTVSASSFDFGDLEVTKTVYFSNYSDADCSFTISNIPEWLTVSNTTGIVKALGNESVTLTVDRGKVGPGEFSQNINVVYSGKASGTETIAVKMKKVELTTPTVAIASSAENIKETSFDIGGSIVATGGSQIIAYGHCWSLSHNPTINDNKTNQGVSDAAISFKSTLENLSTYTTYYVRAYAQNAQGLVYSDEIAVTTQDVASDVWDGNIASSFAGGSGTFADPYIVKTGGQLLLVKDFKNSYFELGGNIDLNNKNWLPYEFAGSLDGKGFAISNLYIKRTDDYQGLFSKCSGSVSNLTVRQVRIEAGSYNNVGAFSGEGGSFINCTVILNSNACILGNDYVGGLSGRNATLLKCTVSSTANTAVIKGNYCVGGLVGYSSMYRYSSNDYCTFEDSRVSAIIVGRSNVGGIVGQIYAQEGHYGGIGNSMKNCSFIGKVEGEDYVGGLCGMAGYLSVTGSKVDASVKASREYGGGIFGGVSHNCEVFGSYSNGNVTSSGESGGVLGYKGLNAQKVYTYLSYSTMTSSSGSFYGLGKDIAAIDCATTSHTSTNNSNSKNVKTDCADIVSFLKDCYSQYAGYWNFESIWTWEGTISGSSVQVKCPKLSWE